MRKTQMICAIASLAILAVAANANAADTATGDITEVGKDFVVLKVKKPAKTMRLQVNSESQITLDGKKAALTDLKKGHSATVTYKKAGTKFEAEKIVARSANASLLPVVFLADDEAKKFKYTGKIKSVNKTTLSVSKRGAKKAYDFQVGSDATIKLDGKTASLKDLKVGQTVTVTYVMKDGKAHAKEITAVST